MLSAKAGLCVSWVTQIGWFVPLLSSLVVIQVGRECFCVRVVLGVLGL